MSSKIDRKFLTWNYQTDDKKTFEFEVRYKQEREGAEHPFTFYVQHVSPSFYEESSDMETLRAKIIQRLEAHNLCEWRPMLFVSIGEGANDVKMPDAFRFISDSAMIRCGIIMSVIAYEAGTTKDGQHFWRRAEKNKSDPRHWRINRGLPWNRATDETLGHATNHYGHAVIPDTPEVRRRLEAVAEEIRAMRLTMAEAINQSDLAGELLSPRKPPTPFYGEPR